MNLSWMGWTQPTAIFFITIASFIAVMSLWEYLSPEGRHGAGYFVSKPLVETGYLSPCSVVHLSALPGWDWLD
jgi:predicted small integral membrane protein